MYNRFKEGRQDVNDNSRPGRRSMSTTVENIEAMKKIILDNHRINIIRAQRLIPSNFTDVLGTKPETEKILPILQNWHMVRRKPCNFFRCFKHETKGKEGCSKIVKF